MAVGSQTGIRNDAKLAVRWS